VEGIMDMNIIENHPVSKVQWIDAEKIYANDYNPNRVAPPEMKLLEVSILENGFTQPIVVWRVDDSYEVVDGFHRHIIGKKLGMSKLPVVVINDDMIDRGNRIAATIRHNRARGKHQIAAMSDIVVELSRRNWSDKKIAKELGMDADEILRLKQITGLAELFATEEFSEAWET
jgi:ParB-like chromosome segregation protein Spo0J